MQETNLCNLGWDVLAIVVGAIDYWLNCPRTDGNTPPELESVTVRWHVAVHPCRDAPYLVGVDFEDKVWRP